MALTIGNVTLKTSGGDYSHWNTFWDDLGDLTGNITCTVDNSAFTETSVPAAVTESLGGFTLKVTAATFPTTTDGTTGPRFTWNAGTATFLDMEMEGTGNVIVEGIVFLVGSGTPTYVYYTTAIDASFNFTLRRNIIKGGYLGICLADATPTYYIYNNVIYNQTNGTNGYGIWEFYNLTGFISNNTIVDVNVTGTTFGYGIDFILKAGLAENNLVYYSKTTDYTRVSTAATGNNNSSYDATADDFFAGTGNRINNTTSPFTNYNADDFTLAASSDPIGNGKDLSASFTTDFFGVTRDATWDIGACAWVVNLTAVSDTIQIVHNVRKAVPDTVQVIYNVRKAIPDTLQIIHNVRKSISDSLQIIHNVRKVISDDLSILYNVLEIGLSTVSDTLQIIFNTRSVVSDNIQLKYNVRKAIPDTLQIIHNVRKSISDSLQIIHNIGKSISDSLQIVHNVRKARGMWTEDDLALANEIRDVFFQSAPTLSVYIGQTVTVTSTDTTHITVANNIRRVLGVWLKTDTTFIGTNYYADPKKENFTGKAITLDSALPAAATQVVVSYYSDCPTCEWDATRKKSRVLQCAACDGTGMVLTDGTAIAVPAEKVRQGGASEPQEVTGETTRGSIVLRLKSEHEGILKIAKRLVFDGEDIVIQESPKGVLRIEPMICLGVKNVVKVYAEYVKY